MSTCSGRPLRPRTAARTLMAPASNVVEIPALPATVATLSSNAIAEAALREQQMVKDPDPLCGQSVEIRPLHVAMPRGNRTADYYRARGLMPVYDDVASQHDEEFDKAIACFTRAIDVDGGCGLFFKNRAFAFRKAGRYAEAAKDYTTMGRCDRTCPVYNGSTTNENGMFYYDAQPLYTPRDSSIRAVTTMDRTDPRICYKASPTFIFHVLSISQQWEVHRSLCTQVCGVRLTASTVLFQEDEPGAFVYLLLVGRVNLFKHNLVKPDTSDSSRPTVETYLKQIPKGKLHSEAALLDLDNLRQQTFDPEETPMYTLRPGAEFGHQGRFRHLPRYDRAIPACTAVVEADAQMIIMPWATVMDIEADESSVVHVPGQAHEGLLLVRRGVCKLVTHNASMLGSRRPRGGVGRGGNNGNININNGVKKTQQHNALHAYTTMEHEDSPVAFFHANQALTRHLLAVPASLRPETVHKRLVARDFIGEESFLSNETNRRVLATYSLTTDSECELIFLRKADFFADTSYYTRQRVRANIQHMSTTTASDLSQPCPLPTQQMRHGVGTSQQRDREGAKWIAFKKKLVHDVLHKQG
ncbi:hypothetical protein B5M09_004178 [Aphanomyces astaci]|uniref:Cyclic nucleotide-binding domain-containing protein n=2 Tax=Aphanomyces astaci TaxID=112090 RepID=A0A425DC78_APHAT|nr:hypothetical protein B5M09_004178 [Aphanomyces astaci]